jgi:hypothetical protein
MPKNKSLVAAVSLLALLAVNLVFAADARAGYTYKVLHTFMGPDGSTPGPLIFDAAGNLYGVAVYDGKFGNGNVFKLTHSSRGVWTQTALYSFKGGTDGSFPDWVVLDSKGNLIVVCSKGGTHNGGAIFRLTRSSAGQWKKTVLYDFKKFPDVSGPGAVAFDNQGNLYGNAAGGDINGGGSIFKLTPVSHGPWILSVVHRFSTTAAVGFSPSAPVMDGMGNFYGTTLLGGTFGYGGVFNLTSDSKGWHLSVLHIFGSSSNDGLTPSSLILDKHGDLYGTTAYGGTFAGVVFKLTHGSGGQWTESILYDFKDRQDGGYPLGGLLFDKAGNLIGTTAGGGGGNCLGYCGVVFQLTPTSQGGWKESVLHEFIKFEDGQFPDSVLVDSTGNLYGTTLEGGGTQCPEAGAGCGVVYELMRK